jgi:ABC-2 type transport system ATP-binding protein
MVVRASRRPSVVDNGSRPSVASPRPASVTNDVLTGVDFTVRRGEVITLLGPNGAGKSTTIEILEGFWLRSAGAVSVLGVVLQSWRDHGRWRVRDLLAHLGSYATPVRP